MKRSRSSLKFSAVILALALAPCSALFAQDYEIRLDRPDPVGSKCHLAMVGKQSTSQVVKQGDKVLQEKSSRFAVEAELVATVLAVSEKGAHTRVKIEVEKLVRIEGDARKELVPKGSVITVSWDGKGQAFDMAGGAGSGHRGVAEDAEPRQRKPERADGRRDLRHEGTEEGGRPLGRQLRTDGEGPDSPTGSWRKRKTLNQPPPSTKSSRSAKRSACS